MKKYNLLPINFFGIVLHLFLKMGRDEDEAGKAVLPTIIFINTNHKSFFLDRRKGFIIAVGWWDFSFKFGLIC